MKGYFQSRQRKELAACRSQFERVRQKLEREHPFMDLAAGELGKAEQLIDAMDGPAQKARWIYFLTLLQQARNYMVMAEADTGVVRDRVRQAGTRKKRLPEINDWLDRQLERDPDIKSPALWPKFIDHYDSINTDPPIEIDAFKKRLTKARRRCK